MGREAKLAVNDGTKTAQARVHLDSEMLTVGPPFRLKLKLADITACEISAQGLNVGAGESRLTFALTPKEAASWAKAVLNPPSLATKLGLKPGLAVAVLGTMPNEIGAALAAHKPARAMLGTPIAAALTFAAVPGAVPLGQLGKLPKLLPAGSVVWLVYEKGGPVNGDALIAAARAAGLKDTKVAKISETHTGLRFIPAT